jgi:hypothetical protein
VEGGAAITLCSHSSARGGSWGEDGNIIAALNSIGGLSRSSSAGGMPMLATELAQGEYAHRWPQILPGGNAVLFTATATASASMRPTSTWCLSEIGAGGDRRRKTLVRGRTYGGSFRNRLLGNSGRDSI